MLKVPGHRYIETILLTSMVLGACFYFNPHDPLFINASFPWIWFLPILIAVRHGRLCAFIATIFIVAMMVYTLYALYFSWDSYQTWLFGGVILVLIYVEYQNLWLKRQYGLQEKAAYLDVRLESLSRAYGALRLSHDRLEESLIIKPATFRQAFYSLRQLLAETQGQLNEAIATQYLELLAFQAGLNSAALYLRFGKKWETNPIAYIGENHLLNLEDILVQKSLKSKAPHYLALNILEDNQTSDYLAVLPMVTADDHVIGILTITSMPFLMLNNESLKTLAIMLAYIADEVWAAKHAVKLQHIYPDCPAMFATEIFKLAHLWKIAEVDSAVVVFTLNPNESQKDIIGFIIQEKRALDIIWQKEKNNDILLIILMPLTQRNMLTGYIERIKNILWERKQLTLGECPILFEQKQLSSYKNPYALLKGIL